ncbi:MAG TPA: hypothetical protein VEU74_06060 [Gemmatimonadales bacterium]|nr:hypothetical protein [Gemmatimonadales bacterium]
MSKVLRIASLLTVSITVSALAQHPAAPHAPAPHVKPAGAPTKSSETRGTESGEHVKSFDGIAKKLGMTPQQLQTAYEQAQAANPKLTRGQFIAANVLAHNLGEKNPAITTQAILDGLKSGKSIGQTLHSLGLSEQEAKEAEQAADKEANEADRAADKAAKTPEKKPDQPTQPKPNGSN